MVYPFRPLNNLVPLSTPIILNFYGYKSIESVIIYCTLFITIFFFSKNLYITPADTYSRVCAEDFFVNTFYYIWTSFWYIPTSLVLFYLINVVRGSSIVPRITIFYAIVVLFFVVEIWDYWNLNTSLYCINFNPDNINILLTNSINKYHPFIFYYALLSVFLYFNVNILNYYFSNSNLFNTIGTWYSNSYPRVLNLFSIVFTLFLGSWWALQEGSWGGWWNWDPSEVFGLVVMVILLIQSHSLNLPHFLYFYKTRSKIYALVIAIIYVFIQLNFNLVSHNFGIKVTDFVNTSQLFTLVLVCLCLLSGLSSLKHLTTHSTVLLVKGSGGLNAFNVKVNAFMYITYTLIIVLVLLSFYPLIADFLWNLYNIKMLNWFFSYEDLVYTILVFIALIFWTNRFVYTTAVLCVICLGYWQDYYLLLLGLIPRFTSKLHWSIMLVTLTSITSYYLVDTFWVPTTYANIVDICYSKSLINWSTLQPYLVLTNYIFENSSMTCTPFSFLQKSTSLDINMFMLKSSASYSIQNLIVGISTLPMSISVMDNSINILFILVVYLLHRLHSFFLSKTIIMF